MKNILSSTASTKTSLEAIRNGEAGLTEKRKNMLARVPCSNDWATFEKDTISIKNIAYLSAATHHEFALLRGKAKDIIVHGVELHCHFNDELLELLQAKKLGIRACIDAIGYEFCKQHADNSTSGYGVEEEIVYCFVGVSDQPAPECDISKVDSLILAHGTEWPYSASCNVDMQDGRIEMLEVKKPNEF